MAGLIFQPSTTVNVLPASQSIGSGAQRMLFIGQMTSGTATSGALEVSIGNSHEEDALFGKTSILAQMIRQAKKVQGLVTMDAIPLADNGTTKAAGSVAFSGTATAAGALTVSIGSRKNYKVSVAVSIGDTATVVGDALVAAYAALAAAEYGGTATAPFTVVNTIGTVAVTATNAGTVGNSYGIEVSGSAAGITYTVAAMTGGATDPVLTGLFDVIAGTRYQTIVWQSNFALSDVATELDSRLNVSNVVMDGRAFVTLTDTLSNIKTAANALNSPNVCIFSNKLIADAFYKGPTLFEFNDVISAQFAAIRALRLTSGSNIAPFIVGAGAGNDAIGGPASASLPYFNTPMALIPASDVGKGFTLAEVEELATAGASVIGMNKARTGVITGEVFTTYKTDVAGNPNTTWKFLNYIDTASEAREYISSNLQADFAQTRLTTGDLLPGRSMVNESLFRVTMIGYYSILSGADYALLQSGSAAAAVFSDNLVITLDMAAGSVTFSGQLPLVTQTRTLAANFQITFETV